MLNQHRVWNVEVICETGDLIEDGPDANDAAWPTNREVKVRRVKRGFGRQDFEPESRRPRPEPRYKRHHRRGRQHPGKCEADPAFSEPWEIAAEMEEATELACDLSNAAVWQREELADRLCDLLNREEYHGWWQERFGDGSPGYYAECDCPSCVSYGYDYDYGYDDRWLYDERYGGQVVVD